MQRPARSTAGPGPPLFSSFSSFLKFLFRDLTLINVGVFVCVCVCVCVWMETNETKTTTKKKNETTERQRQQQQATPAPVPKRKKSLPDPAAAAAAAAAAAGVMSREEASVLSSQRREELRRQADLAERYRANPLLYFVSPEVKVHTNHQKISNNNNKMAVAAAMSSFFVRFLFCFVCLSNNPRSWTFYLTVHPLSIVIVLAQKS